MLLLVILWKTNGNKNLFFILKQVLDEADTMFDRGFGPDIRKFLAPLKQRALKTNDQGFQTVLVTATMTTVCIFAVITIYAYILFSLFILNLKIR